MTCSPYASTSKRVQNGDEVALQLTNKRVKFEHVRSEDESFKSPRNRGWQGVEYIPRFSKGPSTACDYERKTELFMGTIRSEFARHGKAVISIRFL